MHTNIYITIITSTHTVEVTTLSMLAVNVQGLPTGTSSDRNSTYSSQAYRRAQRDDVVDLWHASVLQELKNVCLLVRDLDRL